MPSADTKSSYLRLGFQRVRVRELKRRVTALCCNVRPIRGLAKRPLCKICCVYSSHEDISKGGSQPSYVSRDITIQYDANASHIRVQRAIVTTIDNGPAPLRVHRHLSPMRSSTPGPSRPPHSAVTLGGLPMCSSRHATHRCVRGIRARVISMWRIGYNRVRFDRFQEAQFRILYILGLVGGSPHGLCSDEAPLEVCVDDARCLGRCHARLDGPGPRLGGTRREVRPQAQLLVRCPHLAGKRSKPLISSDICSVRPPCYGELYYHATGNYTGRCPGIEMISTKKLYAILR